jgi:hypothetical protein
LIYIKLNIYNIYIMNNLICECPLCKGFYFSLNFCKKIKNNITKIIKKDTKYIKYDNEN